MPPLPPLHVAADGTMTFTHNGVMITIVPNHFDRRRLRYWTARIDGKAIAPACSTPTIAAALAIAVLAAPDRRG